MYDNDLVLYPGGCSPDVSVRTARIPRCKFVTRRLDCVCYCTISTHCASLFRWNTTGAVHCRMGWDCMLLCSWHNNIIIHVDMILEFKGCTMLSQVNTHAHLSSQAKNRGWALIERSHLALHRNSHHIRCVRVYTEMGAYLGRYSACIRQVTTQLMRYMYIKDSSLTVCLA